MDRGPTEGVGVVEVPGKDFPSIQAVHSQDVMVADLLQQAAEAGGVVEGQAGVVLEQGCWNGPQLIFRQSTELIKFPSQAAFVLSVIKGLIPNNIVF